MVISNNGLIFFKEQDTIAGDREIRIIKRRSKLPLDIQNAIKTRIRRDNDSKYHNLASREIKKWFESRRI